jgi:RIO kinase 1
MHNFREPAAEATQGPTTALDPRFVFDFSYADLDEETQRWSTWRSVQPLCRGPEPRPDWVVTEEAAVDTELGVLKTGKEAEVFLVERAVPDGGPAVVMAAKRYRAREHRTFHRSASYTEGWSTRRSRDARGVKAKSRFGR